MNYKELLKSPKWQKKRLEVFQRDGFKCTFCSDSETQLQVHHLRYHKNPIEQSISDLVTLCKDCHEITSGVGNDFKKAVYIHGVKYLFVKDGVLIKTKDGIVITNLNDLKEALNG